MPTATEQELERQRAAIYAAQTKDAPGGPRAYGDMTEEERRQFGEMWRPKYAGTVGPRAGTSEEDAFRAEFIRGAAANADTRVNKSDAFGNLGYGMRVDAAPQVGALAGQANVNYATARDIRAEPLRQMDTSAMDAARAQQSRAFDAYANMFAGGAPSAAQAQFAGQTSGLARQGAAMAAAGGSRGMRQALGGLQGGALQAAAGAAGTRSAEQFAGAGGMAGLSSQMRGADLGQTTMTLEDQLAQDQLRRQRSNAYYGMGNSQFGEATNMGLGAQVGNANRWQNQQLGHAANTLQRDAMNFDNTMYGIGNAAGAAVGALNANRSRQ